MAREKKPKPEESDTFVPSERVQKLVEQVFGDAQERAATERQQRQAPPKGAPPEAVAAAVDRTRKQMYLEGLAQGLSHSASARAAGCSAHWITSQITADEEFARQVGEAYSSGTDYFEDLASIRAHYSDQILIRILEARRPERYRAKQGSSSTPVIVNVTPLFPVDRSGIAVKQIDLTPEKQHEPKQNKGVRGY